MTSFNRQRDALFGAGCGLLFFGVLPSRKMAAAAEEPNGYITIQVSPKMSVGLVKTTQLLSLVFAVSSLMCTTLSCVSIPRATLRWILPMLFLPLLLASSISTHRIYYHFSTTDLVSMVSTSTCSPHTETFLEARVNYLYCKASIRNTCERDTVIQAQSSFPSMQWPSNAGEDMTVAQACARDLVIRGPTNLSTGCRVCRQNPFADSDADVVLKLIQPTLEISLWCSEHLTYSRMSRHRTDSPYRHRRLDLLKILEVLYANRVMSVRLLMVLDWFAVRLWLRCFGGGGASTFTRPIRPQHSSTCRPALRKAVIIHREFS